MHKFLHLSDIHLDSHYFCRSEATRARLRQAHRDSFARAIDAAIEEKVLAIFLVGDVFEAGQLSYATEQFLIAECRRLEVAQIPCIYVTGDRDAIGGAAHASPINWPENVIFVHKSKAKIIELQDVDGSSIARVACLGNGGGEITGPITSAFPNAKEEMPYFGVMHATVTPAEGDEKVEIVGPVPARTLKRSKYTYWALGHLPDRQQVKGSAAAWYPGIFFGRDHSESGPRGGLMVTLRPNREIETEFRPFAKAQWETLALDDLSLVHEEGQLVSQVSRLFDPIRTAHLHVQHWMLELRLSGPTPFAAKLQDAAQRAEIEVRLAEQLRVEEVRVVADQVTLPVDTQAFRNEPHVLSEVLALLDNVSKDSSLLDKMLPEPTAADLPTPDDREAYLADLVQNLEHEAVIRLLQDENHAH